MAKVMKPKKEILVFFVFSFKDFCVYGKTFTKQYDKIFTE